MTQITNEPLRRLNDKGKKSIKNIYDKLAVEKNKSEYKSADKESLLKEINEILFDDNLSEIYKPKDKTILLDQKRYFFIHELITHLRGLLLGIDQLPVLEPNGCYSWLTFFYIESFLQIDHQTDSITLEKSPNYYLLFLEYDENYGRGNHRNFLFSLLNLNIINSESKFVLSSSKAHYDRVENYLQQNSVSIEPYFQWGDPRENAFYRKDVARNKEFLMLCDELYIEEKPHPGNGLSVPVIKTGSASDVNLGNLRRLCATRKSGGKTSLYFQIHEKWNHNNWSLKDWKDKLPKREYGYDNFLKPYDENNPPD